MDQWRAGNDIAECEVEKHHAEITGRRKNSILSAAKKKHSLRQAFHFRLFGKQLKRHLLIMEELETVHPDYQKGFNEGYTMAEHLPELADKLANIESNSERTLGFKAGYEQYILDKHKDLLPKWLRTDQPSSSIKKDEKEKDKGDREKE